MCKRMLTLLRCSIATLIILSISYPNSTLVSARTEIAPLQAVTSYISIFPRLSGVVALASGGDHTCALINTGGVKCWGENGHGQLGDGTTEDRWMPVDVSGLTNSVKAIAASYGHTCALTTTGGVKCWGRNDEGQLGDGTTDERTAPVQVSGLTTGVAAIAAGGGHTCALTSTGAVKCWGNNYQGQLGNGTNTDSLTPVDVSGLSSGVTAISSVDGSHTCALNATGGVKCWGDNGSGQLGDGTFDERWTPVQVNGLTSGIASIRAGRQHTCAVTTTGGVKCWGKNEYGQLGNGANTNSPIPVNVSGLSSGIKAVAVSAEATCALTTSGEVKCWGSNYYGQLGDGTGEDHWTPVQVNGLEDIIKGIEAGGSHICAITTSGEVNCWGRNHDGQLGAGLRQHSLPLDVSGLGSGFLAIAASSLHTCAITATDGVKCWGNNEYGQLGNNTNTNSPVPVDVSGLSSGVSAISVGGDHTCALTATGGVKCWGNNENGQLGDGSYTDRWTPVNVSDLSSDVTAISAGWGHTCALTTSGGAKCWGRNWNGQLGDGTTESRLTPVDVSTLTSGVLAIDAGSEHTCAITTMGKAKCWGANWSGRLGDGTTEERWAPADVSTLSSGVTAISAGSEHTCALTSTGGVKCWGNNQDGRVGDGTTEERWTPVGVSTLSSGVMAISAGGEHTCARTTIGGVKCWGNNTAGQLGDGTITGQLTPTGVSGLAGGVTAISAGLGHACALVGLGRPKCWGSDILGQLGLGTAVNIYIDDSSWVPVDVIASTPLLINYLDGQPGSFMTLTGVGFPAGGIATVIVNGHVLTDSLAVNETGGFIFFIDTSGANAGYYLVVVSANPSASVRFRLNPGAPLRVQEGGGFTLNLPAGIAIDKFVFLPLLKR